MIRVAEIALLILCIGNGVRAQSAPVTQVSASPEEGFVSQSKYTNAFFGFSLSVPQDRPLQGLSLPSDDPSRRFLFGLKCLENGVTAFTIAAAQSTLASSEEARKAAAGPKGQSAKRIEISGKEFWKSESQDKSAAGKMRIVKYATVLAGYVLEFNIISFDRKLTDELARSIESITFFDPAKAQEMAGADSRPYNPLGAPPRSGGGAVPQPSGRIEELTPGAVLGNHYTNDTLGLSYQFPAGWYVTDKETQEKIIEAGHEAAWGDSPSAAREHEVVQRCMKRLLWTSQYPEGTSTEGVNSLIVIFAADPDCFPGTKFPTSSDDEESIRHVAEALVRSFQGTPLVGRGSMKLRVLMAQGQLFLEVSGVSRVSVPGRTAPVELHNSMVFTSVNDFWVIWLFSSGSEAGLQELKNTKITFSASGKAP